MKSHKSINHFTGKEQNALHCITKMITQHVQPLIIYCFGSSTNDILQRSCFDSKKRIESWQFTCDLLVVLPDSASISEHVQEEIVELTETLGTVRVILHPLAFVKEQIEKGNLFFSWVHSSAIILYKKDNATLQFPARILKRQEHRQQAKQFYIENPNLDNYLTEQLVVIEPVAKPIKEEPVAQIIEVNLRFELKDGKCQLIG